MHDATLVSQNLPRPDSSRPAARPRLVLFDNGRQAIRTVGLVIVLLSVFVSSGSFLIMTGATDIEPTPEVWTIIWVVNGLLVLSVVALVMTEATLAHPGACARAGRVPDCRSAWSPCSPWWPRCRPCSLPWSR